MKKGVERVSGVNQIFDEPGRPDQKRNETINEDRNEPRLEVFISPKLNVGSDQECGGHSEYGGVFGGERGPQKDGRENPEPLRKRVRIKQWI